MRVLGFVTLALVAVLGCTDSDDGSPDGTDVPVPDTPAPPSDGALSAREKADLLFMREEEKLARDVYDALDVYGQPFANVQTSEQRHFDAMGALIVTYGLDDPAAGKGIGELTDPDLQALYGELVARGMPSQQAALQVGCAIEELDLRDLEVAKAATTHADIVAAYDNLMLGSRNHLRAYYGQLVAVGGMYTPIYIDQAAFDAVVTSPREQGGM